MRRLFTEISSQNTYANTVPCKWHFNKPSDPHFGGLWEVAVKTTKYHLKRVIGTQLFTFEEKSTVFARVEAISNSRSLIPQSSDPYDYRSLTPGDFLIEQPLVNIPDHDLSKIPKNRLNRWELIRQLYQSFWKR